MEKWRKQSNKKATLWVAFQLRISYSLGVYSGFDIIPGLLMCRIAGLLSSHACCQQCLTVIGKISLCALLGVGLLPLGSLLCGHLIKNRFLTQPVFGGIGKKRC